MRQAKLDIRSLSFNAVLVRRVIAGLIPVVIWVAGTEVPLLRQGVLFLAPFFLLLALWTAGVDPEPILRRIRRTPKPRPVISLQCAFMRAPQAIAARGGLLVASSLAGRAPPVAHSVVIS